MGAHMTMARLMRAPTPSYFLTLILAAFSLMNKLSFGLPDPQSDALLEFKSSLGDSGLVLSNWGITISPCKGNQGTWYGVYCFDGKVRALRLENLALEGMLNLEPLTTMPYLKAVSIMNNTLQGPLPNLKKVKFLRSLYLTHNRFSGEIPDDAFEGMKYLRKLFLGDNEFSGKIPLSLAKLTKLKVVGLEDNSFSGKIPNFESDNLLLDLHNNELEGEIPEGIRSQDPKMFAGNGGLCGEPLAQACPPSPAPAPAPSPSIASSLCDESDESCSPAPGDTLKKSTSLGLKVALGIVSMLLVLVLIAILFMYLKKKNQRPGKDHAELLDDSSKFTTRTVSQLDAKSVESKAAAARRAEQAGKLSFVRDDRDRFDLHDLLRASAEILGSGTFGASYKALILTDVVVVKRYKQMNNVGRDEFHDHMRRLGRLTHQNLLPLVAYYYRREEKLLVSDYVENGSLASHLHGNHNLQSGLDWPTRLGITKGIGRGLTYLYNTLPSLVVPHGHLKSSNVLLDENMEPLLNDYALLPVINMEQAQHLMMAYKAPEYAQLHRITKKTDVWCFGLIILEVLTGKFPENYLMQKYDSKLGLANWVNGMIKEKRTNEVFDGEMGNVGGSKGELLKLLKIGVSCCEEDVEIRMDMHEVVAKIEELNEGESDGDYRSSVSSEGGDDHTSDAV